MTKDTTKEAITKHITEFFASEGRHTTTEEDVLDCLDDLNANDGMLGDDYLLSFDCLCNVSSQSDGSTIASYSSYRLGESIIINPMFDYQFANVQEMAKTIIEANDAALALEEKLTALVVK